MKQVMPYLTGALLAFMLLVLMAADSSLAEAAGKKKRASVGGGCQTLSSSSLHTKASPYHATIRSAANQYGVNPNLVKAVITVESCFRSKARGSLGEKGLMQLMPGTARRFDIQNGYNATQNIHGGARYLSYLLKRYNGNMQRAVAAYNAGEGRIKPGGRIPNKGYVNKVLKAYGKFSVGSGEKWAASSSTQPPVSLPEYKASVFEARDKKEKAIPSTVVKEPNAKAVTQKVKWGAVPSHKTLASAAPAPVPAKVTASSPQAKTGLPWSDLHVHYRAKAGDTVYEVMRQTGTPVKSLIRMNGLKAPYHIQAGQTLRVK